MSYDFSRKISGGIEYYADYGRLGAFDSLHMQQQQIFFVTDLNVSPKWEINFGLGVGPTASTDHLIFKAIIGRHFSWKKPSPVDSAVPNLEETAAPNGSAPLPFVIPSVAEGSAVLRTIAGNVFRKSEA